MLISEETARAILAVDKLLRNLDSDNREQLIDEALESVNDAIKTEGNNEYRI